MDGNDGVDGELIAHISRCTGLGEAEARHLIVEVLSFYDETAAMFVRRRHRELQQQDGMRNAAIFRRIAEELAVRRFAAEPLSERQVRRMIYG